MAQSSTMPLGNCSKLPFEFREQIYHLTFPPKMTLLQASSKINIPGVCLLQTSRTIRDEVSDIIVHDVSVHVKDPEALSQLIQQVSGSSIPSVRYRGLPPRQSINVPVLSSLPCLPSIPRNLHLDFIPGPNEESRTWARHYPKIWERVIDHLSLSNVKSLTLDFRNARFENACIVTGLFLRRLGMRLLDRREENSKTMIHVKGMLGAQKTIMEKNFRGVGWYFDEDEEE